MFNLTQEPVIPFKVIVLLLVHFMEQRFHCKAYKDLIEIQELGFVVSFFKVLQLLIDGDIESNPGSVTGAPKSRKASKRIFNFTQQK